MATVAPASIDVLAPIVTGAVIDPWATTVGDGLLAVERVVAGPVLYNVRSYTAPVDGVSDSQPSFQAAVNAAIASGPGSTIVIPHIAAGYLLNSPVVADAAAHGNVPLKLCIKGSAPRTRIYAGTFAGAAFQFLGADSGNNANAYCDARGLDVWANSARHAGQGAFKFKNCLVSGLSWCQAFNFDVGFDLETSYGIAGWNNVAYGCNKGLLLTQNGIVDWHAGAFDTNKLGIQIVGVSNNINFWGGQWDSDSLGLGGEWNGASTGTMYVASDASGAPNLISVNGVRIGTEQTPSQGHGAAIYILGTASDRIVSVTFNHCRFVQNDHIAGTTSVAAYAIEAEYMDNLLLTNCISKGASGGTLYLGANMTKARSILLSSAETAASGPGAAQYAAIA